MAVGMAPFDWLPLLSRLSGELLQRPELVAGVPPEITRAGWLGFPPATEEHVRQAEARLGTTLPPSYWDFLKVTNGWWTTGAFEERLLPADEIEWYRVRHPDLVEAWLKGVRLSGPMPEVPDSEYLVYDERQETTAFRDEYLPATLQISELCDGVYLLNPQIITDDGEWEAWYFAAWLPGAIRYRSFWEMMHGEHDRFLAGTGE
jgi:hypothetical protein